MSVPKLDTTNQAAIVLNAMEKDAGLSDFLIRLVQYHAEITPDMREAAINEARARYENDDVEIEDDALICSGSEGRLWVSAWVLVRDDGPTTS